MTVFKGNSTANLGVVEGEALVTTDLVAFWGRASRTSIWGERMYFNLPQREMPDPETTVTRVRYFGKVLPMEFALCLRMRKSPIRGITLGSRKVQFETFHDNCSTFVYIPIVMDKAGIIELTIKHPPA